MLKVAIIERKNTNNSMIYRLEDELGNKASFKVNDLIKHIISDRIQIINLTYQEDKYLIDEIIKRDRVCLSEIPVEEKEQIRKALSKAEKLGLKIETLPTFCGHECYLIYQPNNSGMLIIPSNVTIVNAPHSAQVMNTIKNITGQLTVIGGESLEDATYLFKDSQASILNLTKFKPKQLTSVKQMFKNCKANKINIEHINISNNADREEMFTDYNKEIQMSLYEKQKQADMMCNKINKLYKEGTSIAIKIVNNTECLFKINEIEKIVATNNIFKQLGRMFNS